MVDSDPEAIRFHMLSRKPSSLRAVIICSVFVCLLVTIVSAAETPDSTASESSAAQNTVPITTSSPEARRLFDTGIVHYENLHTDTALQSWRAATKADPNFAIAHLFLSYISPDPAEQVSERARAKALAPQVTRGEQLMIGWMAGARENDYVHAIADMN
ncbi:MAG: hypothetical protein JO187_01800, partial [Acidobacteria bacterium]|nr:hypothetical protein [Acidobacteriota bacterium]